MATAPVQEPIVAREDERKDILSVQKTLDRTPPGKAKLVGPGGQTMLLPQPLHRVLVDAARQLAHGNGISIMPYAQELTTQQAADLLNVSRPHLVSLLEAGAMPYHKTGTHRRIIRSDLLAYKQRRDGKRREALQSLVDEAQDLGIYED